MITITPYLINKDVYTLQVCIVIAAENRIVMATVRDRFGLMVYQAQFQPATNSSELELDSLPRGRFPLFLSAIDDSGVEIPSSTWGPIFASPTDNTYTEGIPLPRGAIDITNDPVIRSWQSEILQSSARVQATAQEVARLLRYRVFLSRQITLPMTGLIFLIVGAYVTAILAPSIWQASPLAFAALGLSIVAGILLRRIRTISNDLLATEGRLTQERINLSQLDEKLQTVGAKRMASPGTGCGCGCQEAR